MKHRLLGRTWMEIQAKLLVLRSNGYEFLCTHDDGLTWRGTNDDNGISIEMLLMTREFRGNVVTTNSSSSRIIGEF